MEKEAKNPITTELVKNNVTDAVLKNIKIKYLPLKINGIDDKEGYDTVHKARIVCRDLRVLTEKLCKKGREDATKIQKAWIQKEKEVVAEISEVEQHLKKQEDAVDAEKEAIKIRQERLLKLPVRREQVKGIEVFLGKMTDDEIMGYDDNQWNQAVVSAQGRKLAEQQKEIDDAKAKELLQRTIERENELIATGAILYSDGLGKVYRKGQTSVSEQMVRECIPEGWPKIIEVFKSAVIPEPVKGGISYKEGVTDRIRPIIETRYEEVSDEEALFRYASQLENCIPVKMKTEAGQKVLGEARELITKAINILRQ